MTPEVRAAIDAILVFIEGAGVIDRMPGAYPHIATATVMDRLHARSALNRVVEEFAELEHECAVIQSLQPRPEEETPL